MRSYIVLYFLGAFSQKDVYLYIFWLDSMSKPANGANVNQNIFIVLIFCIFLRFIPTNHET